MSDFKKNLLINGGIIAFSILAAYFGAFYFSRRINNNVETILTLKQSNLAANFKISELADLKRESVEAASLSEVLQNILPTRDNLFSLPKTINNIAKSKNIKLGFSFSGETPGGEGTPSFVSFNMTAEGALANIISFIKSLEEGKNLIRILSADLTGAGSTYSARINGQIFYMTPKQ